MDKRGGADVLEGLSAAEKKRHRSRIKELKTNMDKVEYLMLHFPETRKQKNLLCYLYWNMVEQSRSLVDIVGATGADNILRNRNFVLKKWKGEKK